MIPLRRPALALCLLLAAAMLAGGHARAQSLLSIDPTAWEPPSQTAAEEPVPAVETVLQLAADGRRREAYRLLRLYYPRLILRAAEQRADAAEVDRRLLLIVLRAGDGFVAPAEQERTARRFVEDYPQDARFPVAFFYLTQARFRQGEPLPDSLFFDEAALRSLPAWMQSRYLRMRAEDAARRGDPAAAAAFALREKESAGTLRETTEQEVMDHLERLNGLPALEEWLQQRPVEWMAAQRPFLEASVLINAGEMTEGLLALEHIRASGLATTSRGQKFVLGARNRIERRVMTRPERIGVVLPLGSSSAAVRRLARDTLDGLRLAIQFRGAPPPRGQLARLASQDLAPLLERPSDGRSPPLPDFELVVRDTALDPQRAAEQVEALVRREDVVAIVGPIARAESAAATQRAEELGVPLISLSLSLELPLEARYAFRHSKSQESEVRDLVRYAMDYAHARRFAILYPDTSYGQTMMELFWDEAARRGGEVVAAAGFTPWSAREAGSRGVGFQEIFEAFTGVNRPLPPEDRELWEKVGDKKPDPIVDFDALFIPVGPDGSENLRLIAPYPVTVDAENVMMLGSRFWNSNEVLAASEDRLDGAVFIDAYDRSAEAEQGERFRGRHRAVYGHRQNYEPPSFYTALGYDSVRMLMELLRDPAHRHREALARALHEMPPFEGVTGTTAFTAQGEAVKESMFFRIDGDRFVRFTP